MNIGTRPGRLPVPIALLALLLVLGVTGETRAQDPRPGVPDLQDEEGQRISEYDFAVSHAMRALMATGPEQGRVTVYVARKEGELWHVYFGSFDARQTLFRIAYEVVQDAEGSSEFRVRRYDEEVEADAELSRAAAALVTALDAFEPRSVRFHTYVWRDSQGRWIAYFVPTVVRHPLGPTPRREVEQRVVVSPDARRILETREYPDPDSDAWLPPARQIGMAEMLALALEPQLAPLALIGQTLVCEMNWQGEIESCLIAPPR